MTAGEVAAALQAYLPQRDVKSKIQSKSKKGDKGMIVWFVTARGIMDRLDAVVGPHNWRDDYVEMANGVVMCRLSIRFGDEWITKCDVSGQSAQPELDDKVKAAFSGALKRAAVKFGIGRYLYSVPMQWVEIDQYGKPTRDPAMPPMFLPKPEGSRREPPPSQPPAAPAAAPPKPASPTGSPPPSSGQTPAKIAQGQVDEIERLMPLASLTLNMLEVKLAEQFRAKSVGELTTDQANRTIAWLTRVAAKVSEEAHGSQAAS